MALGLIEIQSFAASIAALDAMTKAADVAVMQVELNDLYGTSIRIRGATAAVQAALDAGTATARQMHAPVQTDLIARPDPHSSRVYMAPPEVNPLIEQAVVHEPAQQENDMAEQGQAGFAIGLIETQGFTAVIEAIDTACKAAAVEVIGREKLGGGYIAVLIKGDVAAVQAAVDAGRAKVEGLGKLIAAHVIPRPSRSILSLLPGS